jgi:protein-S-isoprenylcysteine O-methyltransferase Ste14
MQNDRPNTIPWPPIVYVSAVAMGVALQKVLPLPELNKAAFQLCGGFLALVAIAIDMSTFLTFRKHKTTILPNKGATNLITTGPFAWSRNPIYVANTVLVLGLGLYFENWWMTGLAFVAALATQKLAIEREETHLAKKFGKTWNNYAARVRRWL